MKNNHTVVKEKLAVAIVFGLLAGYSETVPVYAADDVQTVKASKTAVKDDFFQQGEGFFPESTVQWGKHDKEITITTKNEEKTINTGSHGQYATAWGENSTAYGLASTAWGQNSLAQGSYSTVWGQNTIASGAGSTAWGSATSATKQFATAWGQNTIASGDIATAWGNGSVASGRYATAWGENTEASGVHATAWGQGTEAGNNYATAWGNGSVASGHTSTAFGHKSKAEGSYSVAFGYESKANATNSVAFGYYSQADAKYSIAMGEGVTEKGADYSVAIGGTVKVAETVALGYGSVADRDAKEYYQNLKQEDLDAAFIGNNTGKAWFATANAIAVGGGDVTRQITGVAAGTSATDAVNVGQLQSAIDSVRDEIHQSGGNITIEAGNGIKIEKNGDKYTISSDLDFGGDIGTPISPSENQDAPNGQIGSGSQLDIVGGITDSSKLTENNIGVVAGKDGKLHVQLGKDLQNIDRIQVNDKIVVGNVEINEDGKISGVADGKISADSTDAVNGSQLHATNQKIENITQDIDNINGRVNKLDGRIDKVAAGAAALAALHPLGFDPDEKLTFSAGVGNYKGETAAALGAFYHPDEKTIISMGGTIGNGENMVNLGISFALDNTSNVNNSKVAMAKEIVELRSQVMQLTSLVNKMAAVDDGTDNFRLFPDVPENHWAYEYIYKLAAQGVIEGYPDGNFCGDRMMTRYEFAAILYRAMQSGAPLESKILNEFEPELGRIRVDLINGNPNALDKVERVRVNSGIQRDHYGSVVSKAD